MSDIVDRLRAIPVWMVGAMTPGWQEHGTSAYEAVDLIESLRAENTRLTEERDALALALQMIARGKYDGLEAERFSAIECRVIASAALAKVKGGPDAR